MVRFTIFLILISLMYGCGISEESAIIKITSPTNELQLEFIMSVDGRPGYKLYHQNEEIIEESYLGFSIKDQIDLKEGFGISKYETSVVEESWEQPWGENRQINNHYAQLNVSLQEQKNPGRKMNLVFKLYDDGLGFRYEIPEQDGIQEVVIMDELTEFNLTGDHMAWWIPGDWDTYEQLYRKTSLSGVNGTSNGSAFSYVPDPRAVNTPVTMKTDDSLYLSFHEANLTDYAGMTLHIDTSSFTLTSSLVGWEDGSKVITKTPFVTPWRTVQVSESAGGLIESNLILNLNEPSKISNTDWIKPAKYMGIWWEMHIEKSEWDLASGRHGATTENAKKYIDYASEHGIEGLLIEGWNVGWENWTDPVLKENTFDFVTPYEDFDLKEVVAYGKEKNVFLVGHHETSASVENYEQHLDSAFQLLSTLGIPAVKTGYVGAIMPARNYHHGQYMVRHYRKVIEKAAEYKVMIDAHEPIKGTGIRRTWPNMVSREGVRGQEYNAWSDGNPPNHTLIVPFTRMLAGPIDFTPGIFNVKYLEDPMDPSSKRLMGENRQVNTTLTKQLALYVVLYSPVQMVPDLPEFYDLHLDAFKFIEDVPVDWETTQVINGEIEEYVTIVRKDRNSENWYLGSITDETARSFNIQLSFLPENKNYKAIIYKDKSDGHWDHNPISYEIVEMDVTSSSNLELSLAPGGGTAIEFLLVD